MFYWRAIIGANTINWRTVIKGFILAVVLSILFGAVAGTIGSIIGVIIAGIVVGYMVKINIINGVIHGAIIGAIAGIILSIIAIIMNLVVGGTLGALEIVEGTFALIITLAIFGAIGGAIGSIISGRSRQIQPMGGSAIVESETQPKEEMKPKVAFNIENLQKCICDECRVQAESECTQTKMKMLYESMKGMDPKLSDIPGMYCANGIATCKDLGPDKMCNCSNCDVFKENNLANGEPGGYFCQNGKAM
jgi:hypothetical protein